jgi:hypothetical protein
LSVALLLAATATLLCGVKSEEYSVGDQYNHIHVDAPFILRWDEGYGVGDAWRVAVSYLFTIRNQGLGAICTNDWQITTLGGKPPCDKYDFTCTNSPADISKNNNTNGFEVGSLNCDGRAIADCKVKWPRTNQRCDPRTIPGDNKNFCTAYIRCIPP